MIAWIKANWKQAVGFLVAGFILGAILIGPLAAGIQSIKDKIKFADKQTEEKK